MEAIKIYEADYLSMFLYSAGRRIIRNVWTDCEDMTEDEYKEQMLKMVATVEKYSPSGMLVDVQALRFVVTPDLQDWGLPLGERIRGAGVDKVATLVSSDIFSQISVEQYFEENEGTGISFLYFDDEQKAWDWLES